MSIGDFLNNAVYSLNKADQTQKFSSSVESRISGTFDKIVDSLKTVTKVAMEVFGLGSNIYQDYKKGDLSKLREGDLRIIPTSVENFVGENFVDAVCSDEEKGNAPHFQQAVEKVGVKIIGQTDRKDLNYQFLVKDDSSENAFVIPGGRIVLTTGLLQRLEDECDFSKTEDEILDEFEKKVAVMLSYLVARSAKSDEVKHAQLGGLLMMVGKIIDFVVGGFLPEKARAEADPKRKLSENEETKIAVANLLEGCFSLGSDVIKHSNQQSSYEDAKETGLQYANKAGYSVNEEEFEDELESFFEVDANHEFKKETKKKLSEIGVNIADLFSNMV